MVKGKKKGNNGKLRGNCDGAENTKDKDAKTTRDRAVRSEDIVK